MLALPLSISKSVYLYSEGESIQTHISFLIMENRKLGDKGFDDESLARPMLVSLLLGYHAANPRCCSLAGYNWQSPVDVAARLMQEPLLMVNVLVSSDVGQRTIIRGQSCVNWRRAFWYCQRVSNAGPQLWPLFLSTRLFLTSFYFLSIHMVTTKARPKFQQPKTQKVTKCWA
jgi:hypothetical protein